MMPGTLNEMPIDELWALREMVDKILAEKLTAEKAALDLRLKQLSRQNTDRHHDSAIGRRRYPKVLPKFRNPDRPSDTWTGRGKLPRWLSAELKAGRRIDDFRIECEITRI
jgi:DNA-binding protein H-NS